MDIINFRVTPDGENIELYVEVPDGPNYRDIQIDKIAIQDHNHYTVGYPEKPQIELTKDSLVDLFKIINNKRVIKRIPIKKLGIFGLLNTGMYFMYVKQEGIPKIETPCSCNKEVTVAVAANLIPIYLRAIKHINSYTTSCNESRAALLDLYIKKNMFLSAIELEEYSTAIDLFNNVLKMDLDEGKCLSNCSTSISTNTSGGCKTC